jgi:hypothetical protein
LIALGVQFVDVHASVEIDRKHKPEGRVLLAGLETVDRDLYAVELEPSVSPRPRTGVSH